MIGKICNIELDETFHKLFYIFSITLVGYERSKDDESWISEKFWKNWGHKLCPLENTFNSGKHTKQR